MGDAPGTRASLLVRLRDPHDRDAWRQFVALYAPLIYGLARRRGLQDADAADLTQEVLRTLTRTDAFAYDPARGSFRGWLYTVTCRKVHDFRASRAHRERGSGDSVTQRLLEAEPAADEDAERWECEYRRHLFTLAAEQVKDAFTPTTWQAFWLLAVEGKTAEETATATALSVGAVYVAKSRVLARLKKQIELLEAE
jgi:RNA polymerase sigma factor (sigma-70 family)